MAVRRRCCPRGLRRAGAADDPRAPYLRPSCRPTAPTARAMKLVIFGSSLVSAYWNGAATYYRGICKAMHARGHEIVFVEPDLYERQQHRDLVQDPPYAEVRVCAGWDDLARELERARDADLVAKCSGIGGWD